MGAKEPEKLSIRRLLMVMVKQDASDLYIAEGLPPAYRIKGVVIPLKQPPLNAIQTEQLANATMSERQRAEFAETMEMNLAVAYDGMGRFRVNIFRQRTYVGMVIRKITGEVPTMDQLQLPEVMKKIIMEKRGLLLMVGATSSGKSTSMAAMLDYRNSNEQGHIITIEDPIEFVHRHKKSVITQREVGTDTVSFKAALKNTLRQAPDVILVGEIRDRETMEHALEFAETGHLCVGTLHANNANQTLDRIMNLFPEESHPQIRLGLAMNLKAIISQRLIKTVDGGRKAAIEILINNPRISDLIEKWSVGEIKEAMEMGGNYGMQTFDQHLLRLWREGFISEESALANSDAANDLRLKMKMAKLESSDGDGLDQLDALGDNELSI
ncbi:MAG: PilT/PilU family type 4a pilus ATPase [Mariprofundaceae bacterium]|nr:PilT/PilU family type 4a pilus ATPase [Mariprofundaceae bacterium]